MDFVHYIKRINWKFLGRTFLTKEEIYNENSGEGQIYQITVNSDYYEQEFKLGKDTDQNNKPKGA